MLFSWLAYAEEPAENVWVDMSHNTPKFEEAVAKSNAQTMNQYQLHIFEQKGIEQKLLMSKIDFWSKNKLHSKRLDQELTNFKKSYLLSSSNRLVLFEYLKTMSDGNPLVFKNLCHLYANDYYLKEIDPFFESSCSLTRLSLGEINPDLVKYDFLMLDGNKIDLRQSPYFFTSGSIHQFIFISNRYVNIEITDTAESLKSSKISAQPWVDGHCDKTTNSRLPVGMTARI